MKHPLRSVLLLLCLVTAAGIAIPESSARTIPSAAATRQSRRTLRQNVREESAQREQRRKVSAFIGLSEIYENKDVGVQIRYPKGWEKEEPLTHEENLTLAVIFLSPGPQNTDAFRENINLVIEALPSLDISLNDYTMAGLQKELSLFNEYTLLDSRTIALGNRPAQRIFFTAATNLGQLMKFEQIWYQRGMTMHVWTFADGADVFDAHAATFERMLDTLIIR